MKRTLLSLIILSTLLGCGQEREPVWALTRLVIRASDTVPASAFDAFADTHLGTLFPTGVTRLDGRQQWRNADKTVVSAPCVVFDIIHLASPDNAKRVEGALFLAKKTFGPGAVMLIEGRPDVRF
jgi:hypothetical protein